jgi:hypothetical protein
MAFRTGIAPSSFIEGQASQEVPQVGKVRQRKCTNEAVKSLKISGIVFSSDAKAVNLQKTGCLLGESRQLTQNKPVI